MANDYNLVKLGRFGRSIGDQGVFAIRPYNNFQTCLLSLKEFFILFDDQRVRFVKIECLAYSNGKLTGQVIDAAVAKEVREASTAWLTINEQEFQDVTRNEDELLGFSVYFGNEEIGEIIDYFNNGEYDVFIVEKKDSSDESFMIPDVDEFVLEKDIVNARLIAKNIQELIDL